MTVGNSGSTAAITKAAVRIAMTASSTTCSSAGVAEGWLLSASLAYLSAKSLPPAIRLSASGSASIMSALRWAGVKLVIGTCRSRAARS